MPMSSGGRVASSSECATRPKVREIGLTGYAVPTRRSLLIGRYVMATAERREPCDSRGSCTVLGAPGGETPPGDSTLADVGSFSSYVRFSNRPSGSSAFRLSTTPVSMSLTGSCFSSDSAPRPFHHGIRRRGDVCAQSISDSWLGNLRECLAHLV